MDNENIVRMISTSIDDVNQQLPKEKRLMDRTLDTVLIGKSSKLDSLGLVLLIVALEQKIEDEYAVAVVLSDDKAMSLDESPFRTIETLAKHISLLVAGA